jgi:hypothetical protein
VTLRRRAPYLASIAVVAGLFAAPAVGASAPDRRLAPGVLTAGHVAFVSKSDRVELVTVKVTGHTSRPTRLGPVTKPPAHRTIQIQDFIASGDGNWLAWLEVIAKPNGEPTPGKAELILRDLTGHHVFLLRTNSFPIGFAGDQAVVSGAKTSRVVLQPSPHLVHVPGAQYATAAYPVGVVDVKSMSSPPGPDRTDQLRLTAFDGTHTVVHDYRLSPDDTRIPDLGFVSGDGNHLAVERGDHTDFGGIGPSSLVDEFSLRANNTRTTLGHYGTAKAAWRIGDISFARPSDRVWAVWERATTSGGATSVVAEHHRDGWVRIVPHGIAVAGNRDGYVVVQPGKYVFASDGLRVSRVPTTDALLLHDTSTRVLGIEGSQFAWVL